MNRRIVGIVAATALVAGGVSGGVIAAQRGGGDDNEPPITGEALERATRAALDYMGGGRVTETEVGDEDSFYEVEVTLDDGRQYDVQLDRNFKVLYGEADDDGPGGEDADGDD